MPGSGSLLACGCVTRLTDEMCCGPLVQDLGRRRNRGRWLMGADQCPVSEQLMLVYGGPLEHLPEYARQEHACKQRERVDADRR